jgi:hypothetical protein
MEIACVIDCRLAAPERPGRSGGLRPGRGLFDDPGIDPADDPVTAAELTEAMAQALEGIGAGVETERAGEIFFAVGGLRGLYGGEVTGVKAVARRAVGVPVLIGVAPTRTAARAAAERGETVVTEERLGRFLASVPVAVLVDRLLAAPARKGRTLLGVRLGARLCGGGSWSVDQGLGRPTAASSSLRRLLVSRLESLPGPAEALRLRALAFGPPAADQLAMEVGGSEPRRRRLGEAVREVRAVQGTDALLRVLPVDVASRVPERRYLLTPFPEL